MNTLRVQSSGVCSFVFENRVGVGQEGVKTFEMTLKQQIHDLVEGLPDDSPLLIEVRETLRMNRAIGEALADVREGRTYAAEEFMTKVERRWPPQVSR